MEDITKKQLFLLLLLVSIVTGVSSGIIVYSLIFQTSQPITQVIQNVIDKTKESPKEALPPEDVITLEKAALARDTLIQDIAIRVSPAVISIIATKDVPVLEQYFTTPFSQDDLFSQFFPEFNLQVPQLRNPPTGGGIEKKQVSAGSGFLISKDGFIITNRHVVEDKDAEYTAILNDGKKMPAKVIARDQLKDFAVLKVEGNDFLFLSLGDSDLVKLGQTAIAIGNALGEFQNTVSIGIISGLRRTLTTSGAASGPEELSGVFQTDAAINPGNSGGPLLNLKGEVIGLNTAIAEGAQNIGFVIPINQIRKSLESVKSTGRIIYPFLGIRYSIITPEIKTKNNLSVDYGVLIDKGAQGEASITTGSPADKAELKEGDIILEFDGSKITIDNPLDKLIQSKKVGDKIVLKILRDDKGQKVEVIFEERK